MSPCLYFTNTANNFDPGRSGGLPVPQPSQLRRVNGTGKDRTSSSTPDPDRCLGNKLKNDVTVSDVILSKRKCEGDEKENTRAITNNLNIDHFYQFCTNNSPKFTNFPVVRHESHITIGLLSIGFGLLGWVIHYPSQLHFYNFNPKFWFDFKLLLFLCRHQK